MQKNRAKPMPREAERPMRRRASRALLIACFAILAATVSGCTKYVMVDAEALCKSWRHGTVSKDDKLTQGTAEIIEGNNKARPNWECVYGEDRAKS